MINSNNTATLAVNANSTLGSTTASETCTGNGATISLTGLVPSTISTVHYHSPDIAGDDAIAGHDRTVSVTADGTGAGNFTTPALTAVNNGDALTITSITRTDVSPNCTSTISTNNTDN